MDDNNNSFLNTGIDMDELNESLRICEEILQNKGIASSDDDIVLINKEENDTPADSGVFDLDQKKADIDKEEKRLNSEIKTFSSLRAGNQKKENKEYADKEIIADKLNKPVKEPETNKANKPVKEPEISKANKPVKEPETSKANKPVKEPETNKANKSVKEPETKKTNKPVKEPETNKANKSVKEPEINKVNKSIKEPEINKVKNADKKRKPEKTSQITIEENKKKTKPYMIGVKILICVVIAFVVALIISFFVANYTEVEGNSMSPALNNGDSLIVEKTTYMFSDPKQFDVVVFKQSETENYVKRVIAIPGQTIQIKGGKVYVDDKKIFDSYAKSEIKEAGIAKERITLKSDEYFVLGDNRNESKDSRDESVGLIKRQNIVGKAWLRVSPFDNFGFIE